MFGEAESAGLREYRHIIHRIVDGAGCLEAKVKGLLPRDYRPEITLEESLRVLDGGDLMVAENYHRERPDEGDFESWAQLVEHAKLFVQVMGRVDSLVEIRRNRLFSFSLTLFK